MCILNNYIGTFAYVYNWKRIIRKSKIVKHITNNLSTLFLNVYVYMKL